MRKQYRLEDLDCAHCASEMEHAARSIEGVDFISVNFLSMKLTLEARDEIYNDVFKKVVKKCAEVEPDCKIITQKYEMEKEDKQTLWRIILAALLLLAAMVLDWTGFYETTGLEEKPYLILLFYLPSYFTVGYDVIWKALKNLVRGKLFDENFLMALATVGAIAEGLFPAAGREPEFHEAVLVMLLYQIGEFFQDLAVARSRRSVTELMDIRPDHATLLEGDGQKTLSPDKVPAGSLILIRPGEKVPLDGVVEEGSSYLDTAALTGESRPREVLPGDEILSGSVNMNGVLRVRTTKTFGESSVSKILELIENSGDKKSKAENFISRFAHWYTPVVVILAVLLAVVPPLTFASGEWMHWLHKAITCLVISCPCALVISVPLAFFGGIGGAGRKGILIKGADSLEALANVRSMAFDKTGTLTQGVFIVKAIHPDRISEDELLELAAACENYSDHPISQSLKAAFNKEIDKGRIGKVEEMPGYGVSGVIDGRTLYVGNEKLMAKVGAGIKKCPKCHHEGTVVHVSENDVYLGHIVICDKIKDDSLNAILSLKALGVRDLHLVSGDEKAVVEDVAVQLGIDHAYGNLLPQEKLSVLETIQKSGTTAFVGDGLNDTPVLARADVGIAMGSLGADAAIEAADVVLIDDHPKKIPLALRIARKTLAIVRQNIVFSIGVKLAVLIPNIILASADIPLWLAIFADVGVCILAILNSARALYNKE